MIRNYNSKVNLYYQLSLLLMGGAIVATLAYFWQLGFLDGSRAKNLHQVSYILEGFESKSELNRVKELVEIEDYKLALKKIKEIESEYEKVDLHLKSNQFKTLKSDFQKLKTSTQNLLSFPKTNKVMNVFNTKMDKFYDFVRENRWRTLTRMSDRIYSMTRSGVKVGNIDTLIKDVERDFKSMLKITENSILKRSEKAEITSRIKNLQTEMTMLNKYLDELNFFRQLHSETLSSSQKWFNKVSPELTLQKLQVEQIGKMFIYGLGGLFILSLALFGLSFPLTGWLNRKSQQRLEGDIEALVSERIIESDKTIELAGSSESFQNFCEKMSRYVNKRMSMGTIFQESLPLASILLDENLQVIWSNKFFSEEWMIEEDELKKDYMTWDFLSKLTNLGEEDPVIEALKHGVAGIYQIQVKPSDDLTARPYEMFVSPVEYQGTRRIQLFFYDLRSLEQTIKDQAQGLINPIKANLKRLKENTFEANEETKYEFVLAGIKDVYQLFVENHDKITEEKNSLIDQIEILSSEVERLEEDRAFVKERLAESLGAAKGNIEDLKTFKTHVVGLSQQAREYDRMMRRSLEVINANINALQHSRGRGDTLRKTLEEIYRSVPQYGEQKSELKQLKLDLNDHLNKLISQSKNKLSVELINKWKETQADLDKRLSQLEVLLSKADMVMSSGRSRIDELGNDFEGEQISYAQSEIKLMNKSISNSLDQVEGDEAEIINSLKNIFEGTKSHMRESSNAHSRLTN